MMSILIAVVSLVFYASMLLLAARWRYRVTRPYTEPLACTTPLSCGKRNHYDSCYCRYGNIGTANEAVIFALLTGLVWPFIGPALLARRIVTAGDRPLPVELKAQISWLEAENERLKQQQERMP